MAGKQVRAECYSLHRSGSGDAQCKLERVARMPQPDFGRINGVPMRMLSRFEQEVDQGSTAPRAISGFVAPGFAKPAAFRMRGEIKLGD